MDNSACKHLLRTEVPFISAPKEDIEANCRLPGFPLYESPSRNYRQMKYYSLCTNKYLYCHWRHYVDNIGFRQKTPTQLPKPENVHFAKCQTQFDKPSNETANYRRHMRIGPGTDDYGPLPIPNHLHMRNTIAAPSKKSTKPDP